MVWHLFGHLILYLAPILISAFAQAPLFWWLVGQVGKI